MASPVSSTRPGPGSRYGDTAPDTICQTISTTAGTKMDFIMRMPAILERMRPTVHAEITYFLSQTQRINRPAADARQNARSGKRRKAERQERHAGEIIPPAPPLFSAEGCAVRRGVGGNAKRVAESGGEFGKAGTAEAVELGRRCSGCGRSAGVSFRTHLRWPTPVRQVSDSRVKGRDFQMFWGGIVEVRPCSPEGHLSTLWGPRATSGARADGHKQAGFTPAVKHNARRASDAGRTVCLVQTGLRASAFFSAECQRSGAPGLSSDGRADGAKQAGFTPAVKRNARRASSAFVQCVLPRRALGLRCFLLRGGQRSGAPGLSSDGRADGAKQAEFTSAVSAAPSCKFCVRTVCLVQTGLRAPPVPLKCHAQTHHELMNIVVLGLQIHAVHKAGDVAVVHHEEAVADVGGKVVGKGVGAAETHLPGENGVGCRCWNPADRRRDGCDSHVLRS